MTKKNTMMTKNNKIIHFTILGLIITLAIILRTYNIDTVPSGIYPDEANNGTNAYTAQINNAYQWFYPDNNGREGLYINLIAICFKFFGVSFFTLKLPSILMGVLTVIGVYFFSRELFISKPRLALIASYLTAVSFWTIMFSRIGFRAIMMLPVLTFSFYFIFRGIRTKCWYNFMIGGLIFGLGFHTYIAFRVAPALLLVLFILLIIQRGTIFIKEYWKSVLLFIICTMITAAPLFYTLYDHPEYINARTGDVSIFSQENEKITTTLTKTVSISLMKYNFYGDQNWRHGFPPYPTLETFAGIMFLCGILLSSILFFLYIFRRWKNNIRNRKLVTHGFLFAWFFAFLAPEFLTIEGLPHSLRSIGTLPVVYIFAAFFINFIIERAQKKSHNLYFVISAIMLTLLLWTGFFNIVKYHIFWATAPEQARAFNKDLTDIALYLPTLPPETQKYIITGALTRLPIQLLNTQTHNTQYLYDTELDLIDTTKDFYVILPSPDDRIINDLTEKTEIIVDTISTNLDTSFIVIHPLTK